MVTNRLLSAQQTARFETWKVLSSEAWVRHSSWPWRWSTTKFQTKTHIPDTGEMVLDESRGFLGGRMVVRGKESDLP